MNWRPILLALVCWALTVAFVAMVYCTLLIVTKLMQAQ